MSAADAAAAAVATSPRPYPPPRGVRNAIVTGGSTGIGLACAEALVRGGWNVAISGRRAGVLEAAASLLREKAADDAAVLAFEGDMTREDDVCALFAECADVFDRPVDLVFINAGRGAPAVPIQEALLSDWQAVIDINLTGAWLCAREAFRSMDGSGSARAKRPASAARGGRIILNGSISAHTPRPSSAAYTATKHAISGLTKSLALDGRKHGIAVSQIDIGNAASDMTKRMSEGRGVPQADGSLRQEPTFDTAYVARQVLHMAELPLEVNVQDVVILATNMPSYVGRG